MRTIEKWLFLLLSLATAIYIIINLIPRFQGKSKEKITLWTFRTQIGWGYKITIRNKTVVYQDFMPVIESHLGFPTKETAEKAGSKVIEKIKKGESPALTVEDLMQAGVPIDTAALRSQGVNKIREK